MPLNVLCEMHGRRSKKKIVEDTIQQQTNKQNDTRTPDKLIFIVLMVSRPKLN